MVRYFTGNTRSPNGKVEFQGGETSLGDAVDGVIKIFTIAVSAINGCLLFFDICLYLDLVYLIVEPFRSPLWLLQCQKGYHWLSP